MHQIIKKGEKTNIPDLLSHIIKRGYKKPKVKDSSDFMSCIMGEGPS